jgi:hypothetical protein
VPSFSLLTTSNHHKTQKCRSQDKKSTPRHLRPQDTNACVRHHLHLYLQVLAQSIWYNYSDPGKQTCPHSLSAATPHHHKTQVALMKKDMPHHLCPQDASACIRRHDRIDRSTERKCGWLAPDQQSVLSHVKMLLVSVEVWSHG